MITRDKVERNKISIVVVLVFLLIFLARILFGSKLTPGELLLNLPLYLIVGLVYGIVLQLLNKWLSTKGLLSLLIYPIFGMAILFQFLAEVFQVTTDILSESDLSVRPVYHLLHVCCTMYPGIILQRGNYIRSIHFLIYW